MDYNKLFIPGPPAFYMMTADQTDLESTYLRLVENNKGAVIRKIRGHKSRTVDDFFNEVGAALQFPWYFGENWAAFEECINDLDWIAGDAYLLLVSRAELLLNDAHTADFAVLMRILKDANIEWLTPHKYGPRAYERSTTPFHVLFQCAASDVWSFSHRLRQADVQVQGL